MPIANFESIPYLVTGTIVVAATSTSNNKQTQTKLQQRPPGLVVAVLHQSSGRPERHPDEFESSARALCVKGTGLFSFLPRKAEVEKTRDRCVGHTARATGQHAVIVTRHRQCRQASKQSSLETNIARSRRESIRPYLFSSAPLPLFDRTHYSTAYRPLRLQQSIEDGKPLESSETRGLPVTERERESFFPPTHRCIM